jgi:hypothetical protein
MLLAVALTSLVATFMFMTFFGSQRATSRVTDQIDNRQNARTAIQILERDLRMAGSGWGRMSVQGSYLGAPLTVEPIITGYGGNGHDSITVIGAWDATTTLSSAMPLTSSAMKVASTTGFTKNDFVVLTNGASAHLFQITKIKTSPNEFEHSTSGSDYNSPGGHINWPSGGYPVGTPVYRATWASYFVDTTVASRLKLIRRETDQPDQLVAYDVRNFRVSYVLMDESVSRSPHDTATIMRIIPVVSTRSQVSGQTKALLDSATTEIVPRSF